MSKQSFDIEFMFRIQTEEKVKQWKLQAPWLMGACSFFEDYLKFEFMDSMVQIARLVNYIAEAV